MRLWPSRAWITRVDTWKYIAMNIREAHEKFATDEKCLQYIHRDARVYPARSPQPGSAGAALCRPSQNQTRTQTALSGHHPKAQAPACTRPHSQTAPPIDIGSARTAASFSTPSSLRIAPPSASSWPLPPEKNVPKRKRNGGAVILLPDVSAYGAGIQRRNDEVAAIADIKRLRRLRGVHHDQDLLAVRRLEGHIRERVQVVGADADGAGTNELGRVGDGIVRHVAAHVAAVDGDGALARTASAIVRVRLVPGIGRQIPKQDIAAPVPGGADDQPPHGCSEIMAPSHVPHPPLSVCGWFRGSAARFQSRTLRLQFRVAPTISLRTGAPTFADGRDSTEPVTICSVKYRFFLGWAS